MNKRYRHLLLVLVVQVVLVVQEHLVLRHDQLALGHPLDLLGRYYRHHLCFQQVRVVLWLLVVLEALLESHQVHLLHLFLHFVPRRQQILSI